MLCTDVLVKSYWSQRKWPSPFACQRQLLPHTLQASCFSLVPRQQAISEIWGREFKTRMSTCIVSTSLDRKKHLLRATIFHCKNIVSSVVKIPENCFSLKYMLSMTQCPTKEKSVTTSRIWGRQPHCVVNSHVSGKRLFAYFIFPLKLQLPCKLFSKKIRDSHHSASQKCQALEKSEF